MPNGSSSSGWMWVLIAVLIVLVGWAGMYFISAYQQEQAVLEAQDAAQTAADEAVADVEQAQSETEASLSLRMDDLEAQLGELGPSGDGEEQASP